MRFWKQLRRNVRTQAALIGVTAAVVGLLMVAFCQPVWTSVIHQTPDFGLMVVAVAAPMYCKLPPWLLVLRKGAAGWLLS